LTLSLPGQFDSLTSPDQNSEIIKTSEFFYKNTAHESEQQNETGICGRLQDQEYNWKR